MAAPVEDPAAGAAGSGKQDINPWSVSGEMGEDGKVKAIDYRKLIDEFGTSVVDDALLERFEKVTGHKPHRFMRRQIVFSHRDMSVILDRYEKVGNRYERGQRSSSNHNRTSHSFCTPDADPAVTACTSAIRKSLTSSSVFPHSNISIMYLQRHRWLQDVLDVPLIVMLTDGESRVPIGPCTLTCAIR